RVHSQRDVGIGTIELDALEDEMTLRNPVAATYLGQQGHLCRVIRNPARDRCLAGVRVTNHLSRRIDGQFRDIDLNSWCTGEEKGERADMDAHLLIHGVHEMRLKLPECAALARVFEHHYLFGRESAACQFCRGKIQSDVERTARWRRCRDLEDRSHDAL